MRELSLNVLDIAQNSLSAGATLVEITVTEETAADRLIIAIGDNGRGMTPGEGTRVTAAFGLSHIDRMPLGDMAGTLSALIRLNPQVDFVYRHRRDGREAALDTRELRQVLEGVPLDTPEVMEWIEGSLEEQERALENT